MEGQADDSDPGFAKRLRALRTKIDPFEVSVTLVGQVKAGKTAPTNVLGGKAGLLPSDMNPWTSVVTSLHINSNHRNPKAVADEDLKKLRLQIDEMRDSARRGLSSNVEALPGKTHRHGYVDNDLIQRHVCLGDPDELEENPKGQQGRFYDLSKSAAVWPPRSDAGDLRTRRPGPGCPAS